MENVSREDFIKFLKVRNSGVINMNDIVQGSNLAGIAESTYETILFNFSELAKKYGTQIPKESKPVANTTKPKEFGRFSKYKHYTIEFYEWSKTKKNRFGSSMLGKMLGSISGTGYENIYQVIAELHKVCKKIPRVVHVIDPDGIELWQGIAIIPGSRIRNMEDYL